MTLHRQLAAALALCSVLLILAVPTAAQRRSSPFEGDGQPNARSDPFGDSLGSMRISGNVRTADGRAVPNADIQVRNLERGARSANARADSHGSYAIYNIPPGTYEITASNGIDEARERVQIQSSDGVANVDLLLSGRQASSAENTTTVSLSQYTIPAKARSLYEKAVQCMSHGKLDDAREKVNAAIAAFPKFSEALTLRGMLQEQAGHRDAALSDYRQAVEFDANYPVANLALASVLNSTGHFSEAVPVLGHVERIVPKAWQTYFELARSYLGTGDYATALRNVDRASELQGGAKKESPELHLVRGYALIGLSQVSPGVQELETFLARKPEGQSADAARKLINQIHDGNASASR